jgi:adenylosuccinate synthase
VSKAILLAGLGFGDEGKGTMTDYLVRANHATTVVRYNGGAQAGHKVVLGDGRSHVFAQFGSGTFVPGVRTHLSRFMLVEPFAMVKEDTALRVQGVRDAMARTTIERGAPIITPYHWIINQLLEEARGSARHGSCGRGIGETMSDLLTYGDDVLLARDLSDPITCRVKLKFLRALKQEAIAGIRLPDNDNVRRNLSVLHDDDLLEEWVQGYRQFSSLVQIVGRNHLKTLMNEGPAVFEGAQGILLDQDYGFFPHNTWTNIRFDNALELLSDIGHREEVRKVGVLRAYHTRHGAGPFVSEDRDLTRRFPDSDNVLDPWQGNFRVGHFDIVAAAYALDVIGGVDELAITHMDRLLEQHEISFCWAYEMPGDPDYSMFEYTVGDVAVAIIKTEEPDLDRQARMTERLFKATPVLSSPLSQTQGEAYYVRDIEAELMTSVGYVSYGATPEDKRPCFSEVLSVA